MKILLTGGSGFIGKNILEDAPENYEIIAPSHSEMDLLNFDDCDKIIKKEMPKVIINAAGIVGPMEEIYKNPLKYFYQNYKMGENIILAAKKNNISKLITFGSIYMYPAGSIKKEEFLFSSELNKPIESYGLAKLFLLKLCEYISRERKNFDYITIILPNVYGPHDTSKFMIPSIIERIRYAIEHGIDRVDVIGDPYIVKESLYVKDLTNFLFNYLLKRNLFMIPKVFNFSSGKGNSIISHYKTIGEILNFKGTFSLRPEMNRLEERLVLNNTRIKNIGWNKFTSLWTGLTKTISYNGEPKRKNIFWPLVTTSFSNKEKEAMYAVIDSGNFTIGEKVKQFEQESAKYFGTKFAIMTNSGSSANLLTIASLIYANKIQRGDEIVVPAVGWSTTYAPLLQYGLKLNFVDIDLDTLNYEINQLHNSVSHKTKAIIAVNLLGNPNHFDDIFDIIYNKNKDIILIEDNCEAIGAKFRDKYTGTIGEIGTFSFYYSHQLSTIEGGMILTNNEEIKNIAISLRSHGWTREFNETKDFDFWLPGYNLRPTEFNGAIGIEQLKKLDFMIEQRKKNAKYFTNLFSNLPTVIIQKEIGESSWFGFSIIAPSFSIKEVILSFLRGEKIEYRPIASGNFLNSKAIEFFNYKCNPIPHAQIIDSRGFFVGNSHVDLTEQISKLYEIVKKSI